MGFWKGVPATKWRHGEVFCIVATESLHFIIRTSGTKGQNWERVWWGGNSARIEDTRFSKTQRDGFY